MMLYATQSQLEECLAMHGIIQQALMAFYHHHGVDISITCYMHPHHAGDQHLGAAVLQNGVHFLYM